MLQSLGLRTLSTSQQLTSTSALRVQNESKLSGVAGAFFRGCTPATLPYGRWVGSVGSVETDAYLQRSDYVAHVHAHARAVYYVKDKNLGPKVKILGGARAPSHDRVSQRITVKTRPKFAKPYCCAKTL